MLAIGALAVYIAIGLTYDYWTDRRAARSEKPAAQEQS